jgi:hypothetical protein
VFSGRGLFRLRRQIGERKQLVDSAHWVSGDNLREHIAQILAVTAKNMAK